MKLIATALLSALIFSQNVQSKPSLVYPGVYQAQVKSIKATHQINLLIDVWAGYQRQFIVTLPNVVVPTAEKDAPQCQLKLIKEGLKFTKNQIHKAQKIEVKNIKMEDSTTKVAEAEIYLDDTKLSSTLLKKNYVRKNSIDKTKVWCVDEK